MARIRRSALARRDLIEIWNTISDDNEPAADRLLDRFDQALRTLSERPKAGRSRPELADDLRSFPVGSYILFYRPFHGGIDLIRVLSSYRDIDPDTFED